MARFAPAECGQAEAVATPTSSRVAAAVVSAALLAGCSSDPEPAPPDPRALLDQAKATVDATPSLHFELTSDNVPSGAPAFTGGSGDAARPAKFKGTLSVSLGVGKVDVAVISVDRTVYATLPFTSGYSVIDPAQFGVPDPGQLLDPTTGITPLLATATEPTLGSEIRVGSDVLREVAARLDGQAVDNVLSVADPAGIFTATFGIEEGTDQLRRAVVTGPFVAAGTDSTFTIVLDRFGAPVDISAPALASG